MKKTNISSFTYESEESDEGLNDGKIPVSYPSKQMTERKADC